MNDADVGKQVQQMVRFILQEADEKASEITVAAEEVRTTDSRLLHHTPTNLFSDSFFSLPVAISRSFSHLDDLDLCIYMQEFSIEKLQLVESEKRRVRQEYERKEKQVDVRRKM